MCVMNTVKIQKRKKVRSSPFILLIDKTYKTTAEFNNFRLFQNLRVIIRIQDAETKIKNYFLIRRN